MKLNLSDNSPQETKGSTTDILKKFKLREILHRKWRLVNLLRKIKKKEK